MVNLIGCNVEKQWRWQRVMGGGVVWWWMETWLNNLNLIIHNNFYHLSLLLSRENGVTFCLAMLKYSILIVQNPSQHSFMGLPSTRLFFFFVWSFFFFPYGWKQKSPNAHKTFTKYVERGDFFNLELSCC